MTDSCELAAA